MTLNGLIALILRYFTEFDSFEGQLGLWSQSRRLDLDTYQHLVSVLSFFIVYVV